MIDAAPPIGQGRYRRVARLGQGGMASVFRAWDQRLEVWRAIKVLHPTFAPNAASRARFEQEARTMARLRHRNLLAVHDVGEDDGQLFIVMDLAPGGSLADRISAGPLPPRLAVELARQILTGLHHAHEAGVVHRDIKPHNVLLDADGTPLVSDFGIARVTAGDLTRTGATIGTLAYMAPEQRGGAKSVDRRADVYGVAGTIVAVVTGRDPHDLFVDDESTWEDVPDALIPALRRATRHDPGQRFATAIEFADALAAAIPELPQHPNDALVSLSTDAVTTDPPPPAPEASASTYADDPVVVPFPTKTVTAAPPAVARPSRSLGMLPIALLGSAAVGLLAFGIGRAMLADPPPLRLVEHGFSTSDPVVDPVQSAAMSPDGQFVWFLTGDGLWRQPFDGPAVRILPAGAVDLRSNLTAGGPDTAYVGRWRVRADGTMDDLGVDGLLFPGPDGRFAVVDAAGLSVGSLDGPRAMLEPGAGIRGVAWSPDGTRLAVVRSTPTEHLQVVRTDGTGVSNVMSADLAIMGPAGVAWVGPDTIACSVKKGDHSELVIQRVDADGRPIGEASTVHAWTNAFAAQFSFAAGRLAFVYFTSNPDVYVAPLLDGGGIGPPRRLTFELGVDSPIGWLDDGSMVWASGPDRQLRVLRPGAETPEVWTSTPQAWSDLSCLGGAIVGSRQEADGRFRPVRITGPEQVTVIGEAVNDIAVSCLGARCAWGEHVGDRMDLRWMDIDGARSEVVGSVPLAATEPMPSIFPSASGDRIVVVQKQFLHVVGADGAISTVSIGCVAQAASWMPGDGGVIASCNGDEGWRLVTVTLGNGDPLRTYRSSSGWLSAPRVSPDGTQLMFLEDPLAAEVRTLDGFR